MEEKPSLEHVMSRLEPHISGLSCNYTEPAWTVWTLDSVEGEVALAHGRSIEEAARAAYKKIKGDH